MEQTFRLLQIPEVQGLRSFRAAPGELLDRPELTRIKVYTGYGVFRCEPNPDSD